MWIQGVTTVHRIFAHIARVITILICMSPILFSPKVIHKSQYISQRIRMIYTFSSTSPFNNGARAYYHILCWMYTPEQVTQGYTVYINIYSFKQFVLNLNTKYGK